MLIMTYRYTYNTDKEMMILKMVDLVTGNGRGMVELVQVSSSYFSLILIFVLPYPVGLQFTALV
jgi:hypothetical protein